MPEEILPSSNNAILERIKQAKERNAKLAAENAVQNNEEEKKEETIKTETPITSKEAPVSKRHLSERERIRASMDEIIKKHNGVLSNIPTNSPYWTLAARYRNSLKKS